MNKTIVILAVLAGLVFCVIGCVYATHAGQALPHFFPGYQAGYAQIHTKHSLAAFIVAAACFVYAWFQSGTKK